MTNLNTNQSAGQGQSNQLAITYKTPDKAVSKVATFDCGLHLLTQFDVHRCRGCNQWYGVEIFDPIVVIGSDDRVRAAAFRNCRTCRIRPEVTNSHMSANRQCETVVEEALAA